MLHQVKKGETLSEIARKYEVPMKSIAQTNSLKSMNHLQIGDKLLIPVGLKTDQFKRKLQMVFGIL